MKPSVLDSPIHCARADLAKLRRFIRRDHLYLRGTDFAPGDGRMISLIQHNQPVFLDGDFDSSFRMVHRLSDSWSVQAEAIPGFGFALLPMFDWDKISTAFIPPFLPLLAISRRTLRRG